MSSWSQFLRCRLRLLHSWHLWLKLSLTDLLFSEMRVCESIAQFHYICRSHKVLTEFSKDIDNPISWCNIFVFVNSYLEYEHTSFRGSDSLDVHDPFQILTYYLFVFCSFLVSLVNWLVSLLQSFNRCFSPLGVLAVPLIRTFIFSSFFQTLLLVSTICYTSVSFSC